MEKFCSQNKKLQKQLKGIDGKSLRNLEAFCFCITNNEKYIRQGKEKKLCKTMIKGVLNMNYVDSIRKVMDVSMLRTHVISDNITNFNTPSYKAKKVDGGNVFQLGVDGDWKMTNRKHMSLNSSASNEPTVDMRTDTKERFDGNNVDMNVEMMELTKANGAYGKAVEAINREFALRKLALGSQ